MACKIPLLPKELNTLNSRILAGVGVKFGKDSSEYDWWDAEE